MPIERSRASLARANISSEDTDPSTSPSGCMVCSTGGLDVQLDLLSHVLLELGQDLLAEQLDGAQGALARVEAELHVADQIIDTEIGVVLHLLEASLRV